MQVDELRGYSSTPDHTLGGHTALARGHTDKDTHLERAVALVEGSAPPRLSADEHMTHETIAFTTGAYDGVLLQSYNQCNDQKSKLALHFPAFEGTTDPLRIGSYIWIWQPVDTTVSRMGTGKTPCGTTVVAHSSRFPVRRSIHPSVLGDLVMGACRKKPKCFGWPTNLRKA